MPRVLVAGDVKGQYKKLFNQITKIQSKTGTFDALFCVGTFFDPDRAPDVALEPYLTGRERIPIPCYFVCGREGAGSTGLIDAHPDGVEICKNLIYLGRHGRKDVSGLTVCYLSGIHEEAFYGAADPPPDSDKKYYSAYHEEHVEEALIAGYGYKKEKCIDVLLTAEWGHKWGNLLIEAPGFGHEIEGSPGVHRLGSELSPKYHFAATENIHFALPPYRNFQQLGITRFNALASLGNEQKAKALQVLCCLLFILCFVDFDLVQCFTGIQHHAPQRASVRC